MIGWVRNFTGNVSRGIMTVSPQAYNSGNVSESGKRRKSRERLGGKRNPVKKNGSGGGTAEENM